MVINYSVRLDLSGDTVQKAKDSGYKLYGFKSVKAPAGTQPVVWFKSADFLQSNLISWSEEYFAYATLNNP